MKRLVALVLMLAALLMTPASARASVPPGQPPDTTVVAPDPNATSTTALEPTTTTTTTQPPLIIEPESGAQLPAPSAQPSAPLVQIPTGCQTPPIASVVFVGRVVAKDRRVARYQIEAVRAGSIDGYALGDLIDVRYDDEVQYVDVANEYLVGAAPQGPDLALTSKVRPAEPLFGGNAVIGLTEKGTDCPTVEDPVRTLRVDGAEVDASIFQGLSSDKQSVVLAFAKPVMAVFAIVLALVLVRWLFTGILAAVRHAADGEPVRRGRHPW